MAMRVQKSGLVRTTRGSDGRHQFGSEAYARLDPCNLCRRKSVLIFRSSLIFTGPAHRHNSGNDC